MHKTSRPGAAFMLDNFRSIQDDHPAFPPEQGQQMIDAIARGHLWRLAKALGIGVKLSQTKVGILAAVETPEENALQIGRRGSQRLKPMLHDGSLALSAR